MKESKGEKTGRKRKKKKKKNKNITIIFFTRTLLFLKNDFSSAWPNEWIEAVRLYSDIPPHTENIFTLKIIIGKLSGFEHQLQESKLQARKIKYGLWKGFSDLL